MRIEKRTEDGNDRPHPFGIAGATIVIERQSPEVKGLIQRSGQLLAIPSLNDPADEAGPTVYSLRKLAQVVWQLIASLSRKTSQMG